MTSSSVTTIRARIDAQLASWRSTRPGRLMLLGVSIGLLAALYYAAAKIGLRLAYLHGTVTALWPPVGVGIAALVLYGTRLWPGIVIGDLLVGDFSLPLGTVLGQTVGNTHGGFDLPDVRGEVHVWHGERDRFVPVEHARALAAALPRCRAQYDAQDGHFFFRRRVAEVVGALVSAGRS
jgi:fermentation-respiration switch protein FrsA (DUF1100 family)